MSKQENNLTYEQRLAQCPIHNWKDIDQHLKETLVPEKFWKAFHEIILIRGQFPKKMNDKQNRNFQKEIISFLIILRGVTDIEKSALSFMARNVIESWELSNTTPH